MIGISIGALYIKYLFVLCVNGIAYVPEKLLHSPLFQLMEIVSAFGPLAAYRFLFNNELGGPCAFLEV